MLFFDGRYPRRAWPVGDILRQAPEHRMAGATRRAVLMRFAQAVAHRLHRLSDPEVIAGDG